MEANDNKIPENVLTLQVHDVNACIDLHCIVKILSLPYLENVPGVALDVVGMMNYSGISIPVIDLYTRLTGGRIKPFTLDDSVIVIRNGDFLSGLIVDRIFEIKKVAHNSIQSSNNETEKKNPFISGTIIFDNAMYVLLKTECLVSKEQFPDQKGVEKSTQDNNRDRYEASKWT